MRSLSWSIGSFWSKYFVCIPSEEKIWVRWVIGSIAFIVVSFNLTFIQITRIPIYGMNI